MLYEAYGWAKSNQLVYTSTVYCALSAPVIITPQESDVIAVVVGGRTYARKFYSFSPQSIIIQADFIAPVVSTDQMTPVATLPLSRKIRIDGTYADMSGESVTAFLTKSKYQWQQDHPWGFWFGDRFKPLIDYSDAPPESYIEKNYPQGYPQYYNIPYYDVCADYYVYWYDLVGHVYVLPFIVSANTYEGQAITHSVSTVGTSPSEDFANVIYSVLSTTQEVTLVCPIPLNEEDYVTASMIGQSPYYYYTTKGSDELVRCYITDTVYRYEYKNTDVNKLQITIKLWR